MNTKYDICMMKEFMNKMEDICEAKTIISFLMKRIVNFTRQRPVPYTGRHRDHALRPVSFWAEQEGHVGGALEQPLMGAPRGGGV